ncbi:hypothetical protein CEXT_461011 [Caerostris extrusa]|uniref:Uncharacterized protein n=1 Tax=Caerostris extrusa TaxID=172846 RepID=A0AAV4MUI6_CAEEX|nr:hypothetical protein CEXT_461011 [Caerostris extrusa]
MTCKKSSDTDTHRMPCRYHRNKFWCLKKQQYYSGPDGIRDFISRAALPLGAISSVDNTACEEIAPLLLSFVFIS